MMKLYVIIKSLLFPGAYLRCFWEQIACRLCKIPVEDNRYLRDDELTTHIEHEFAPTAGKAFAVCYIPHFFTCLAGIFLSIIPLTALFSLEVDNIVITILCVLIWWFAVSALCNCFPSIEDTINLREKLYKKGNIIQKIILTPGYLFLLAGAYAERYFISFILTAAVTIGLIIF